MLALRGLHRTIRPYAEYAHRIADYYGLDPEVTSVRRPWEQQRRLYRLRQQGKWPYPVNKPGDSAHNYGLAWDSVIDPADQELWNRIREWVGFRVPGNDEIHAEVPNWRAWVWPRRR